MNQNILSSRRRVLREQIPGGAILLPANLDAPRNYLDNTYVFRQDSHFLYYCGLRAAGLAALLLPDGEEILYGRQEHPDDLVWFGPHATLADHASNAGFGKTAIIDTLGDDLQRLTAKGVKIHYLPPYRDSRRFQLGALLGLDPRSIDDGISVDLVKAVVSQRSIKSDEEIAEIENALSITAEAYRRLMAATRPGLKESELAAILHATALAEDRQQAFNPIVSIRGEVLHNTSYSNTIGDGDLLLVDSGAESPRCYASDITRTFPVSGTFSSRQQEIYSIVLKMQKDAIAAASPRRTNRELHLLAARVAVEGLKDLGLMKGNPDSAVEAGAHALFFPHGLGHMLGQDVHDMEDLGDVVGYAPGETRSTQFGLGFLRLARRLEPGFVITIEPGIYFVPALIEQWRAQGRHREFINYDALDSYTGFGGIRIEDDILITADGHRVLGPPIPKEISQLEEAIGK